MEVLDIGVQECNKYMCDSNSTSYSLMHTCTALLLPTMLCYHSLPFSPFSALSPCPPPTSSLTVLCHQSPLPCSLLPFPSHHFSLSHSSHSSAVMEASRATFHAFPTQMLSLSPRLPVSVTSVLRVNPAHSTWWMCVTNPCSSAPRTSTDWWSACALAHGRNLKSFSTRDTKTVSPSSEKRVSFIIIIIICLFICLCTYYYF